MKIRSILFCTAIILCATYAGSAYAQVNPRAEDQLQDWMSRDPRLQSDPGLMNDPTYLRNHPNFATWLQQHPGAHQQVENMGGYDEGHHWRDRNWWASNRQDWVREHHPDWAARGEHHDNDHGHDRDHDHDHH